VAGDETLLALALGHLLRNALEATAAGARAPELAGTTSGDTALVHVRDWGPGLRTTNPKLLFKLMQSTKPGHRGVGLVTVERIARLHGGELRFESPGDGAVVTLALPLQAGDA
jgi:signal transduction histidine kinase